MSNINARGPGRNAIADPPCSKQQKQQEEIKQKQQQHTTAKTIVLIEHIKWGQVVRYTLKCWDVATCKPTCLGEPRALLRVPFVLRPVIRVSVRSAALSFLRLLVDRLAVQLLLSQLKFKILVFVRHLEGRGLSKHGGSRRATAFQTGSGSEGVRV